MADNKNILVLKKIFKLNYLKKIVLIVDKKKDFLVEKGMYLHGTNSHKIYIFGVEYARDNHKDYLSILIEDDSKNIHFIEKLKENDSLCITTN